MDENRFMITRKIFENMKIHLIAAARPNFMKIVPLYHVLKREGWAESAIVHTGQHYDVNMSDDFFKDLNLSTPNKTRFFQFPSYGTAIQLKGWSKQLGL